MRAVSALPLLAIPLLILAGCASQETKPDDGKQVAGARQCERGESQTGSMLAKKVCGPALSEDERRRQADEAAHTFQPTRVSPPGSGK